MKHRRRQASIRTRPDRRQAVRPNASDLLFDIVTRTLTDGEPPRTIQADLLRAGLTAPQALEAIVPFLDDSGASVRDAAVRVLDAIAGLDGGPGAVLRAARDPKHGDIARVHLLSAAQETCPSELSPVEHDEAFLGSLRIVAAEVASSASCARNLQAKWRALEEEQRETLLAGFETATDGTSDALVLGATVLDTENSAARRKRLIQLIGGAEHPDKRLVLERIVATSDDKQERISARRSLLLMNAESHNEEARPFAAITGADPSGRFEVVLTTPRFGSLHELFRAEIDIDSGLPTDVVRTELADEADLTQWRTLAAETGIVALVSAGEASEILVRAAARASESGLKLDPKLQACARVASAVTRRALLPAEMGSSAEGVEDSPAFAGAGLPLQGAARQMCLSGLELVLAKARNSESKLQQLVFELATSVVEKFDDDELRRRVVARAAHQALVLRASGDLEGAGKAAFAAHRASQLPRGQSRLAARMIASSILAELQSAASDPDETALRRALRERFFAGAPDATKRDVAALDLLEVIAESLEDEELDLPEDAAETAYAIVDAVTEATMEARRQGPRRLPVQGSRAAARQVGPAIATQIAESAVDRGLPAAGKDSRRAVADEVVAFLTEICSSRCTKRCFEEPSVQAVELFRGDEHPSTLPEGRPTRPVGPLC